jgi:hypothetical protein
MKIFCAGARAHGTQIDRIEAGFVQFGHEITLHVSEVDFVVLDNVPHIQNEEQIGVTPYMGYLRLSQETKDKIASFYRQTQSLERTARQFKICAETAKRILLEQGVGLNPRSRGIGNTRYEIRYDFFDKIDSHAKAYFLGFLWADGHNERDRTGTRCNVTIQLQERDEHILKYFRDLLYPKRDKPLYYRVRKSASNMWKLSIRTKSISDALLRLGMVGNKTVESHLPPISDEFMGSFMLGYFDGDGCIYLSKTRGHKRVKDYTAIGVNIDIISNHVVIDEMCEWFRGKGLEFKTKRHRNPHYRHMYVCSYSDARKFYELVYAKQDVSLVRKRNLFLEYLGFKEDTNVIAA